MAKTEQAVFMNMCMIYDDKGNILVQDRLKKDWPGVTFPGGHVEYTESFTQSVIREVKEETGLDIENPVLCGVKQFQGTDDVRYVIIFYKTNKFSGELKSSHEGKVFWIPREKLCEYKGEIENAILQKDTHQVGYDWLDIKTLNTTPLYPSKLRRQIMDLYEGKAYKVYLGNEEIGDPEVTD